jgi:hypothetical protein
VVNERLQSVAARVILSGLAAGARLDRYRAARGHWERAGLTATSFDDTFPPMSVTVYTMAVLGSSAAGLTVE